MITWNLTADRHQTRAWYLSHLELELFSVLLLLHRKDVSDPSYWTSVFNSMTPVSFVFLLGSSDDFPSNQLRIHLGMCLKAHFQGGLDEEGTPPLNVSKLIPWTGASDWTKRQNEENVGWTLAFFSLLPEYRCPGTGPSHFHHYAFLPASFLKMWTLMTFSPQVPSVWYFLITMRWVTSKNVVVKGQSVNVLGVLDHRVPVTTTQL